MYYLIAKRDKQSIVDWHAIDKEKILQRRKELISSGQYKARNLFIIEGKEVPVRELSLANIKVPMN